MDAITLSNLEFNKILSVISSYAYCNYTKELILQIRPTSNTEIIENALNELDELKNVTQLLGNLPISGILDLRPIFAQLTQNYQSLNYNHFSTIKANLLIWKSVKKYFSKFYNCTFQTDTEKLDKPICISKSNLFVPYRIISKILPLPDLEFIVEKINHVFNENGEIKDTASPKLNFIRNEIIKTKKQIETYLAEFINKNYDLIQDQYFTIRNERYVVPIKASYQDIVQGLVHDQSGSGQTLFIEPLSLLPLNNKLIKLITEEKDEIARIIQELTDHIKSEINSIWQIFETLIFLDTLQAKLRFAQAYNATRPQICVDKLVIQNARHPLLHPNCVPLTFSVLPTQSCIIITGPNGGGKTVALKILGINCLLLQSGCYVLADSSSTFKIFENIFSDIGEYQTIEEHLSTFTSHIKRLKEILEKTNSNSLVLLDEIGSGTNPEEGSLLAYGVLRELRNKGAFVLATSHYDLLKHYAFTTPGFVNASMEFDEKTLQPTFKFIIGLPGRSYALAIAKQFKLPDSVLSDLYKYYQNKTIKHETKLLEILEREKQHLSKLKQLQLNSLSEIKNKEKEINKLYSELIEFRRTKKDKIIDEFSEKVKSFLKEIENLIYNTKQLLAQIKQENSCKQNNYNSDKSSSEILSNTLQNLRSLHKRIKFETNQLLDNFQNQLNNSAKFYQSTIYEIANIIERNSKTEQTNNQNLSMNLNQQISNTQTTASISNNKEQINHTDILETNILQIGSKVYLPYSSNIGQIVGINKEKKLARVEYNGIIITLPCSNLIPANYANSNFNDNNESKVYYNHSPTITEKLDLRGLKVEEALYKLEEFLKLAEINKLNKVYLIHGKGTGSLQKAVHEYLSKSNYKDKFRFGRYGEGDLGVTVVEITSK